MRMWMCNPRIMCRQHLLGEYRELFALAARLNNRTSLTGYIRNNLIEPESILDRYRELREEMVRRGYKPVKVLPRFNLSHLPREIRRYRVSRPDSLEELLARCSECRKRFEELNKG
jgi:hypothetical protein